MLNTYDIIRANLNFNKFTVEELLFVVPANLNNRLNQLFAIHYANDIWL